MRRWRSRCVDGCGTPIVEAGRPISGISGLLEATFAGALFVVPAIIGGVLLLVAGILARRRHPVAATVAIVLAVGSFEVMAMFIGGFIPYVCLAIGVVTWTVSLTRSTGREEAWSSAVSR